MVLGNDKERQRRRLATIVRVEKGGRPLLRSVAYGDVPGVSGRRTYYQVLQVDPEADVDVIAQVYRRLAQRYHPDHDPSPEAQVRMRELNQAHSVLKDPEQRALYDAELAHRRDRRTSDRYVRRPTDIQAPAEGGHAYGEAGPPRGPASGSVLDFGRYRGWSLGQVAAYDRDFLEWFERSPIGRQYRAEIAQLKARSPR
jgi:curved DNA-binding protein CbpA